MSISRKDKEDKLLSLQSEVKDFHPLLNALFKNLPNVKSTEHTHGTNEMGADFVLETIHPVLNKVSYVGVVVKIGKINQGKIHDVNRQIEECNVERLFNYGKRRIHIDEIWVVSNDDITPQAQRLIHDKHKSSNVRFITGSDIVDYIDGHFHSFWTEIGSEIAHYLKRLYNEIGEIESRLSLFSDFEADIFIEPEIRFCERPNYKQENGLKRSKSGVADIFGEISSNRITFIEGDPGVGKSKLLRYLSKTLCKPENFKKYKLIPVFFTFKEYFEDHSESVNELVKTKLGDSYEGLSNIEGSMFLLIADSLDECNGSNDSHMKILENYFKQFEEESNLRTIASSRHIDRFCLPEDFLDEIVDLEIAPFTSAKIMTFLKEITKATSIPDRLLEDTKKSALFKDLPKCPIAAILLGQILSQDAKELPSSLPELYLKYIEISVGRWEYLKGLQSQKEYKALDAILQNIAVYMMDASIDQLNGEEAKGFFIDYLDKRNLGIEPNEFFARATSRCSIICLIEGASLFCFKHRSFIEFYYARKMVASGGIDVNERVFQPYWSHVFYFYIGLLDEPEECLQKVINLKPKHELESFSKFLNMSDYLLSAYTASYDTIVEGMKEATVAASRIYLEAIEKRDESILANFSQIHLLWLIQYQFKHSYSYEFFRKGFSEIAVQLIDDCSNDQELALSLFLLDVTEHVIAKDSEFKFLQEYDGSIPTVLSLAIRHEMKTGKKSKYIKKLDRNFKSRLDRDRGLRGSVCKMYETSLRDFILN